MWHGVPVTISRPFSPMKMSMIYFPSSLTVDAMRSDWSKPHTHIHNPSAHTHNPDIASFHVRRIFHAIGLQVHTCIIGVVGLFSSDCILRAGCVKLRSDVIYSKRNYLSTLSLYLIWAPASLESRLEDVLDWRPLSVHEMLFVRALLGISKRKRCNSAEQLSGRTPTSYNEIACLLKYLIFSSWLSWRLLYVISRNFLRNYVIEPEKEREKCSKRGFLYTDLLNYHYLTIILFT